MGCRLRRGGSGRRRGCWCTARCCRRSRGRGVGCRVQRRETGAERSDGVCGTILGQPRVDKASPALTYHSLRRTELSERGRGEEQSQPPSARRLSSFNRDLVSFFFGSKLALRPAHSTYSTCSFVRLGVLRPVDIALAVLPVCRSLDQLRSPSPPPRLPSKRIVQALERSCDACHDPLVLPNDPSTHGALFAGSAKHPPQMP